AMTLGGLYNYSHGGAVGIILPYVLEYNRRNPIVNEKLEYLSRVCQCNDIVEEIKKLKEKINIPHCFKDMGLEEDVFKADFDFIVEHSMTGSTTVNPAEITQEEMAKMLNAVYYGKEIDF
ncbi:MAG: iron-containing alcohol dehydrogenase, partial [Christensenellaceae bacterium]